MGRYEVAVVGLCRPVVGVGGAGKIGTEFGSDRWGSWNGQGWICGSLSILTHVWCARSVVHRVISHSILAQVIFGAFYVPCATLALWSLAMAWTTNPGTVPLGARPLLLPSEEEDAASSSATVSTPAVQTTTSPELEETQPLQLNQEQQTQLSPTAPTSSLQRGMRKCRKCNDNYKPPRAHHDSVTGRCIVKFDHFCPWVCNSIGLYNHKFFILFIFYTILTSTVSLVLLFGRSIRCSYIIDTDNNDDNNNNNNNNNMDNATRYLRTLDKDNSAPSYKYEGCNDFFEAGTFGLFLCTVVFFVFTCCMLCEQGSAITTNVSKIARMKLERERERQLRRPNNHRNESNNNNNNNDDDADQLGRVCRDVNEVFGGTSPHIAWHWFCPWVPVTFLPHIERQILGYDEPNHNENHDDDNNNNNDDDMAPSPIYPGNDEERGGLAFLKEPQPIEVSEHDGISLGSTHSSTNNRAQVISRRSNSSSDSPTRTGSTIV